MPFYFYMNEHFLLTKIKEVIEQFLLNRKDELSTCALGQAYNVLVLYK